MAEYFYEGEIVSVTVASISMGSKRIVGIVRSIRGNFISNQGSMTVDLGNRYNYKIQIKTFLNQIQLNLIKRNRVMKIGYSGTTQEKLQ